MNWIGIVDFFTLIITLSSLFIFLISWKNDLSLINKLSLIASLCLISFYYLSNFLEWSGISDILTSIEDYVAILAPLAYFFFIYTYLQKKSEKNLIENQKEIEDAYRYTEFYKDLFTHDIRNIFQNILLADNIIEQSNDDRKKLESSREILTLIKEQVLRGENLISNVTKLSEIRISPLPIETINLTNILLEASENIKMIYEHRKISVTIPEQNLFVKANNLLQNAFENLLLNAIMHNRNEIIEVVIKIAKEKLNQIPYVKIEFIDNGIGISSERKKEIFFAREEEESKFKIGLGLSFIKKIIEYYKGKIWVEDRIEGDYTKGSNFVLLIPEG